MFHKKQKTQWHKQNNLLKCRNEKEIYLKCWGDRNIVCRKGLRMDLSKNVVILCAVSARHKIIDYILFSPAHTLLKSQENNITQICLSFQKELPLTQQTQHLPRNGAGFENHEVITGKFTSVSLIKYLFLLQEQKLELKPYLVFCTRKWGCFCWVWRKTSAKSNWSLQKQLPTAEWGGKGLLQLVTNTQHEAEED